MGLGSLDTIGSLVEKVLKVGMCAFTKHPMTPPHNGPHGSNSDPMVSMQGGLLYRN